MADGARRSRDLRTQFQVYLVQPGKSETRLTRIRCMNIPHPIEEGKSLVYGSLDGPENSVYCRGRVKNKKVINLPPEWVELVRPGSITVSLTPIGAFKMS